MVGGLLVAASAVGLFSVSTRATGGPEETYVVAGRELPAGTRLKASDLDRQPFELHEAVRRRAFEDPGALDGATLIAPLAAGELVQASAVVAKPSASASREVTFSVDRVAVAASLEDGERVDVVATYGSGSDAFSTVVLRQALVVAIERDRDRLSGGADVAVSVAVDEAADVVALAHAVQLARLTVVRSTGAPPLGPSTPTYRQPGSGTPAR